MLNSLGALLLHRLNMATQNIQPTVASRIFPFVGINETVSSRTDLPRSEIRFFVTNESIAAATGGDDRVINLNFTMPENFSYALADGQWFVASAAAGGVCNFMTAQAQIQLAAGGTTQRRIGLETSITQTDQVQGAFSQWCTGRIISPPKEVFLPDPNGQVSMQIQIFDPTANGTAASFSMNMRFLQYDVTQTHHVSVNTPTLTR